MILTDKRRLTGSTFEHAGRLAKTTWTKLSPLPENLTTIEILYSEQGPQ